MGETPFQHLSVEERRLALRKPTAILPERTFWEKATSMHVYCLQGRVRGERWSRHRHDVVRLDEAGIASPALTDRALALAVTRHKAMFFRENRNQPESLIGIPWNE